MRIHAYIISAWLLDDQGICFSLISPSRLQRLDGAQQPGTEPAEQQEEGFETAIESSKPQAVQEASLPDDVLALIAGR